VITKKNIFLIIIIIKYAILLRFVPNLEVERYTNFFQQCTSFLTCINPYTGIENLDNQFLTFPYSNLMYYVLLPFFFVSKFLGISFVIISYLFFEILLLWILQKTFQLDKNKFIFIVILNPLIIYSVAFLGQLDFIPLTYFAFSLYFLKNKNKRFSLLFILFAISSKIIFIILLPAIFVYFLKIDENSTQILRTTVFTFGVGLFLNLQLFFDKQYFDTVLYGVNKGYSALNESSSFLNNNFLFIAIFLSFITFVFWRNVHRLDFVSVSIFTGFMTIPLFMTNIENLGWFLWSFMLIVVVYISYHDSIKLITYLFLALLVLIDSKNLKMLFDKQFDDISIFLVLLGCIFLIYYAYHVLINNKYFKIKSSPIIVSLTGDSAVGKTTMTTLLNTFFGEKFVDNVELDSFHLHERSSSEWENNTHLNPEMNDLNEYKSTILKLLKGENLMVKNYNHLTGKFDTESMKQIKNFLVIEGLHSLYFSELSKKYDLNIYLDLEESIKVNAKLVRDLERGKTKDNILKEIEKRKSDYLKHIQPQSKFADLYIKTLIRSDGEVLLEVSFKNDYFNEFTSLIRSINGVSLENEKYEYGVVKFEIKINSNIAEPFFNVLSAKIDNLRSKNFKFKETYEDDYVELISKLGIILYMLEKRISEKI